MPPCFTFPAKEVTLVTPLTICKHFSQLLQGERGKSHIHVHRNLNGSVLGFSISIEWTVFWRKALSKVLRRCLTNFCTGKRSRTHFQSPLNMKGCFGTWLPIPRHRSCGHARVHPLLDPIHTIPDSSHIGLLPISDGPSIHTIPDESTMLRIVFAEWTHSPAKVVCIRLLSISDHFWASANAWIHYIVTPEALSLSCSQLRFRTSINFQAVTVAMKVPLKPSAHSTIFVAGKRDFVFCRQRRRRRSSIFDIEDRRQRQKSFMCVSRTQQVQRQQSLP